MFLIRNAAPRDLQAVLNLARHLDSYNLPAHKPTLRKLLSIVDASFRGKIKDKSKMEFLFVAEDVRKRKVIGCSLIISRHGTPGLPHISFQLGSESKTSRFLAKRVEHQTLKLRVDSSGFTEIGGLVVLPGYRERREKLGKQLSHVRFAYMACHPEKFQKEILVEYLPKFHPQMGSRLWESLGQKFTGLSYREADLLSATSKEFILSLFPKEKIYCCLLPDPVVRDLGVPGPGAKISLRILEKIGFRFLKQIDPFDGGPHYGASFSKIPAIRKTAYLVYAKAHFNQKTLPPAIVMEEKKGQVRAVVSLCERSGKSIRLPKETADVLGLRGGETLSVTPF